MQICDDLLINQFYSVMVKLALLLIFKKYLWITSCFDLTIQLCFIAPFFCLVASDCNMFFLSLPIVVALTMIQKCV